jgi:hypothetical protein
VSELPDGIFEVVAAMAMVGVLFGALYGIDAVSLVVVDVVLLGGLAIFIPWAISKADLRELDRSHEETLGAGRGTE